MSARKAKPELCPATLRWVATCLIEDARELRRYDSLCPVALDKYIFAEALRARAREIKRKRAKP